ncbi:cytochrome P450 [Eremomyces bilateralis CBS 781.70]|uniref:Cytochrome P450 n=1 Tax=Eremomyces bilateralis CBS 781.70 TaxID=1392243 RepID=A0A6G1FS10_9PEZI|nr:cytochrome P450 [Eremomyces bilateralis CBS 781.70]KAF1808459.1 cytochrome P450 [Eremomyces bilateralis CBS 781.70]
MKALPVDHSAWTAETDLLPLFHRLTLDTSTEFLFGESLEAQLSALPGRNHKATSYGRGEVAFAHHWESALRALSRGTRLGTQWKWAHNTAFREDRRKIHAFVDHFVQRALSLPQEEIEKGSEPKNGKYIFLYAIAAQTRDPSALRSAALNILIAGRDTTAQLLSWIFLLLAAHPRVFQQLRSRILKEFGTYDAPRNLDFASLKNCRYLQWTMNETLRLFPLVPVNNREAQRDTTLPVGGGPDGTRPVFVGKGEVVEFSLTTMHRRKDFWGPDANEFRPERWEARKMGWNYLPFNGGPRTCLGQQFALTEAGYVVVRLLQRFGELEGHGAWMADQVGDAQEDVGRIEGMGLVRHGLALSDAPGDGVRLRMKEMRG